MCRPGNPENRDGNSYPAGRRTIGTLFGRTGSPTYFGGPALSHRFGADRGNAGLGAAGGDSQQASISCRHEAGQAFAGSINPTFAGRLFARRAAAGPRAGKRLRWTEAGAVQSRGDPFAGEARPGAENDVADPNASSANVSPADQVDAPVEQGFRSAGGGSVGPAGDQAEGTFRPDQVSCGEDGSHPVDAERASDAGGPFVPGDGSGDGADAPSSIGKFRSSFRRGGPDSKAGQACPRRTDAVSSAVAGAGAGGGDDQNSSTYQTRRREQLRSDGASGLGRRATDIIADRLA